ncbi:MAG: hypothetical protein IKU72_00345 [Oscillospiraceae bacterium]|nr:hypothetical protein [Oscillospiraceae bacterium]
MLSQRLEEVLGAIEGVGEIRVMVTLRQEEEFVYAVDHTINDQQQEMTTHHQSEQTHVIVEQNGQEEPLLSTKMAPQVQGVIIVCAGGDNPVVIEKLIQAATAALNISSNRVAVSKLG